MPTKPKSKSFGWLFWLVTVVIIIALAGLTAPMVIRCPKKPDQTEATSNLRQIGLALFEFEAEYGSYPSEETAKLVKEKHPTDINLSGSSSNALFRQLFAAKITQSEQLFYAKNSGTKKPDGEITVGKLLEKGEVGFGYIAGLSTKDNPARPIAFAPIIPGTTKFDPKPFDGKAVILRIDNSVTSLNIDENGNAVSGGQNILSPEHPVWGESVTNLDIRYPE